MIVSFFNNESFKKKKHNLMLNMNIFNKSKKKNLQQVNKFYFFPHCSSYECIILVWT